MRRLDPHDPDVQAWLAAEVEEARDQCRETLWLYVCSECGRRTAAEFDDVMGCCGWEMIRLAPVFPTKP